MKLSALLHPGLCLAALFAAVVSSEVTNEEEANFGAVQTKETHHLRGRDLVSDVSPVLGCTGNGGACWCGESGSGQPITFNQFFGDSNDEKVWGCGGAFKLDGFSWNSQWGGSLSQGGPEATVLHSVGAGFSQGESYEGWEGCCFICGINLQMRGKISDGWYCEKDAFSTGIWLKGKNK